MPPIGARPRHTRHGPEGTGEAGPKPVSVRSFVIGCARIALRGLPMPPRLARRRGVAATAPWHAATHAQDRAPTITAVPPAPTASLRRGDRTRRVARRGSVSRRQRWRGRQWGRSRLLHNPLRHAPSRIQEPGFFDPDQPVASSCKQVRQFIRTSQRREGVRSRMREFQQQGAGASRCSRLYPFIQSPIAIEAKCGKGRKDAVSP